MIFFLIGMERASVPAEMKGVDIMGALRGSCLTEITSWPRPGGRAGNFALRIAHRYNPANDNLCLCILPSSCNPFTCRYMYIFYSMSLSLLLLSD